MIELLIAISIVTILSGMGVTSYIASIKKGRDARRREDVQAISKSLEQYFVNNNSSYPIDSSCSGAETFMSNDKLPTDPKGMGYDLACAVNGTEFCICATMEVLGSGNAYGRGGTSCTYTGGASKDYFCLGNLQ